MAYDAKDYGFQMLNDDEITTSVPESNPVEEEIDEDEDNNYYEISKDSSNADAFSALETAMDLYEQQSASCPIQLLPKRKSETLQRKNEGVQWYSKNDESHFWLNGYVNKQNCRIWSEANPQVYVETPLHPEKLTVWCALWAGGILLKKR
ncbi:uncharacterized protein TNCV_4680111 [Trichonephila clavipes]|nr:uncharacterized protein TNCV_4680111 [Trichonephila clavipes]